MTGQAFRGWPPRIKCSHCDKLVPEKADGTARHHTTAIHAPGVFLCGVTCPGSGLPPLPADDDHAHYVLTIPVGPPADR